MKRNTIIEGILKEVCTKAVCKVCGSCQSHTLRWCNGCGAEYGEAEETLFDAMRVAYFRERQEDICNSHALSISYVAAIHKRTLLSKGVSIGKFIEYVTAKMEEAEK